MKDDNAMLFLLVFRSYFLKWIDQQPSLCLRIRLILYLSIQDLSVVQERLQSSVGAKIHLSNGTNELTTDIKKLLENRLRGDEHVKKKLVQTFYIFLNHKFV